MLNINNTPINNYKSLILNKEVSGGFMLSFTSFSLGNEQAYKQLKEEAIIKLGGYDFRIKQIKSNQFSKEIVAVSTFFDLGGKRTTEIYGGTKKISQFLQWTFKDLDWTYSMDSDIDDISILVPNYGNDNYLKLIQGFCKIAELEFEIKPNNHVHFAKKIGVDNNAQYRYGHNIKALDVQVDTTNLATQIIGHGANGLHVTYTSPNVEKFGIIQAEPISDERFTIADNLVEYIKSQLKDEPEIAITLDTIELLDKELGESVWLIYEPLDITIKSRILSQTKTIKNGQLKTSSVVIGNVKPQTSTDLLAQQKIEIDENKKQTMSYFEQTNDRISLIIEETDGKLEDTKTEFEITAGQIRSEVSKNYIDLNGKINSTYSSITQLSNEIGLKVNSSDLSSEIKLELGRATIQADQINFQGKVFGSSDAQFLGKVSAERIIGNEINGVKIRTSSSWRHIHLEEQVLNFNDLDVTKMQLGFMNPNGGSTNVPYITMGGGNTSGRDKMYMEKQEGLFIMTYSARNGNSNVIRATLEGNVSYGAYNDMYLSANRVISNATITAPDFKPSSTVKLKTNIEEYDGQAMDVINRIGVYSYYLKQDLEDRIYDNQYLGFIAEGATEIKSGDAISLYKAVAYQWKALQEKDEEIKGLVRRVDDLERVIE